MRERDISLLFHLLMHSWLSLVCALTGIKPAALVGQGAALTNWAPWPGPGIFLKGVPSMCGGKQIYCYPLSRF